jgi:hypothetical protein
MAYYSGTASSLTALKNALLTHAQADGWTLTVDVLSKAGVYFQIGLTSTSITCLGCESNAVANPAPDIVSIGRLFQRSGYPTKEISFPCNYEVFGFAQELYLVVNYDVDRYQWMAFGKSKVPGLVNSGGWCGASVGKYTSTGGGTDTTYVLMGQEFGGDSYGEICPALFWATDFGHYNSRNFWVNHGLDSDGWTWYGSASSNPIGIRHAIPLLGLQPSSWNSETALLPLRAYKQRSSYKSSLVVDLEFARLVRMDNLSPGDILTIGPDKWKVFPWYKKNTAARNASGVSLSSGYTYVDHTGTFGWAIRYEGP